MTHGIIVHMGASRFTLTTKEGYVEDYSRADRGILTETAHWICRKAGISHTPKTPLPRLPKAPSVVRM